MRECRTWGSVRGVLGDWHPYRDQCGDATRAPYKAGVEGTSDSAFPILQSWPKALNPGGLEAEPPSFNQELLPNAFKQQAGLWRAGACPAS